MDSWSLQRLKCHEAFVQYLIHKKSLNITHLPIDVLNMICDHLNESSRIMFCRALVTKDRKISNLHAYGLYSRFLRDSFVVNLKEHIQKLMDKCLYTCYQSILYTDWSAYNKLRQPVATITWNHNSPHARLDFDNHSIERCVDSMIRRSCFQVRITCHEIGIQRLPFLHMEYVTMNTRLCGTSLIRWMPHTSLVIEVCCW